MYAAVKIIPLWEVARKKNINFLLLTIVPYMPLHFKSEI